VIKRLVISGFICSEVNNNANTVTELCLNETHKKPKVMIVLPVDLYMNQLLL